MPRKSKASEIEALQARIAQLEAEKLGMPGLPAMSFGEPQRVTHGASHKTDGVFEEFAEAQERGANSGAVVRGKRVRDVSVFDGRARQLAAEHGIDLNRHRIGFFNPKQFETTINPGWVPIEGAEGFVDTKPYILPIDVSEQARAAAIQEHDAQLANEMMTVHELMAGQNRRGEASLEFSSTTETPAA